MRNTASSQRQYGSTLAVTQYDEFTDQGHAPQANCEVIKAERGAALSSLPVFQDTFDYGRGRPQRASLAQSIQAGL